MDHKADSACDGYEGIPSPLVFGARTSAAQLTVRRRWRKVRNPLVAQWLILFLLCEVQAGVSMEEMDRVKTKKRRRERLLYYSWAKAVDLAPIAFGDAERGQEVSQSPFFVAAIWCDSTLEMEAGKRMERSGSRR